MFLYSFVSVSIIFIIFSINLWTVATTNGTNSSTQRNIIISTSHELQSWLCDNSTTRLHNNVTLHLNQLNYTLYGPWFCHIENISHLTIVGNVSTGQPVIYCTHKNDSSVGFGFFNMTYLVIKNLQFFGCGATITSQAVKIFNDTRSYLGERQKAGLVFNHCQNLSIIHVNIKGGYGYGLMLLNTIGILDDANLIDGAPAQTLCSDFSCTRSGLVVVFKDSVMTMKESYDSSELWFTNTNEERTMVSGHINNIPQIQSMHYMKNDEACNLPIIGAAGITVILAQTYSVNFVIHNVHVGRVNYGSVAGGILVIFLNGMKNSHVHVSDSQLSGNSFLPTNSSILNGGTDLSIHSFYCNRSHLPKDLSYHYVYPIYINGVLFSINGNPVFSPGVPLSANNHIKFCGTMYINIHDASENDQYIIHIENSSFSTNYATSAGSAIYAILNNKVRSSIMSLILDSCTSDKNLQGYAGNSLYSTVASMTFVNWNNVTISGKSIFTNNLSPAINVYNSNLNLKEEILFQDNVGSNGAAISLHQSSYLILHERLNATFINNEALLYGGAIYSDGENVPGNTICALQIYSNKTDQRELDINMTFIGNKAGLAGNSIYVNPLYNCSQSYSLNTPENIDIRKLLNITFESSVTANNRLKQMSSQPVKICSCKPSNKTSNSPIINCAVSSSIRHTIQTYPGKSVSLYLAAVDGSNHIIVYSPAVGFVSSDVHGKTLSTNTTLSLKSGQSLVPLSSSNCTLITYNILNANDKSTHGLFTIATPGNPPTWFADVEVDSCPKAFMIMDGVCTCNHFITNTIDDVHCNITTTSITRPIGSWFGDISVRNTTGLGHATICPQGNCKATVNSVDVTELSSLCVYSKTGVLCGQCQVNLSVVFGMTDCKRCSDIWLLTLIGYGISGVVIVTVLLTLHLTIAAGPLAGIILTCNIITVSTIDYLQGNEFFLYAMRVFVSLMNLNLGFPLCLYDGMTPSIKTGLQFIYPTYLWILLFGFIILSRYSTRISNLTAASSIQVLATLIHLSFSKLLITTIDILVFVPVETEMNGTVTVWYGDGNVFYLHDKEHIILFCLALVTLVFFIIPYILFVTFGVYCMRWRRFNNYIRPFVESFHGPYKNGMGYWFGVRVIVVVYIYIVYASLRGYNISLMLFMQLLGVASLTVIQALIKPFRSPKLNYIDISCLSILSLQLVILAINRSSVHIVMYCTASLTLLLLLGFISLIFYQVWKKYRSSRWCPGKKVSNRRYEDDEDYIEPDEMRRALLFFNDNSN